MTVTGSTVFCTTHPMRLVGYWGQNWVLASSREWVISTGRATAGMGQHLYREKVTRYRLTDSKVMTLPCIYCIQQSIPFHQCKYAGMGCWWWRHRPHRHGSVYSSVVHGAGFLDQSVRPVGKVPAASVHRHSRGTSKLCQLHTTIKHSTSAMQPCNPISPVASSFLTIFFHTDLVQTSNTLNLVL